jgi:hypothetical protein
MDALASPLRAVRHSRCLRDPDLAVVDRGRRTGIRTVFSRGIRSSHRSLVGVFVIVTLATPAVCCNSKTSANVPTAPTPVAPTPPATPTVTSVSISGSTSFSALGQTSQLSAIANYSNATTENVTGVAVWQTSNPVVAAVSGSGLLTARGLGAAQVTASHQGQTATADVTVSGPPTPACTVSLSEYAVTFDRPGGARSVNVQASPSSCSWQATSNASWLRITSGSTGTGNGVLSYQVDAHTGSGLREGTIGIAGQILTVRQTSDPNQCGFPFCYTVNPTERIVSSAGGSFSLIVTGVSNTGGPGTWEVYSNPPWLNITGGRSGTGTGTVTYFVQSNTSVLDRVGEIVVGGISRQYPPAVHRVTQRGR